MNILLVACGGFLGSIARFYISLRLNKHLLGTMVANITGAIFLAWMAQLYVADTISTHFWLFSGVGFSGAYTTFSTFGNETLQLILKKKYLHATSYVVSSLGIAIALVALFVR